jgi:hypothetical protein
MRTKGQVSTEVMILLAVLLVMFLAIIATINHRENILSSSTSHLYAKSVGDNFAALINAVFLAGDGTTANISLPESLKDNSKYDLSVQPAARLVIMTWSSRNETRTYTSPIVTGSVSGNLSGITGTVAILNNGHEIFIS